MNNSSHRPGHRAGHHRGRPAPAPRRWTSVLLALLVLVVGLAVSAPAAVAELSAQDTTTPITSDTGAEVADVEGDGSEPADPADPETTAPTDEEPSEPSGETDGATEQTEPSDETTETTEPSDPSAETTETNEPSADTSEEPADPTDGESTESTGSTEKTDLTDQGGKSSQSSPKLAIAPMATSPGLSYIRADTTFYAYVGAGENIDILFTQAGGAGGVTITVRAPGAAARTCTKTAVDSTGCSWPNLTSGTPGIWEIKFDALGATSRNYDWTINVQNAASASITGRVYTERYTMTQIGPTMTGNIALWYQSEHGFQYRADYYAYNGADSTFASDATGVAGVNTCVSAYRSMDEGVKGVPTPASFPYADNATLWLPPSGQCGDPYKIFFEAPSASLPATAKLWDGTTDWLRPPVALPTLSDLAFTRDSAATTAGEFTFDVSDFTGQLEVLIDANNDGDYTDAVDTSVPAAVTQDGTVTVDFDGRDGQGNPIPSTQPIGARVAITKVGEIHFVNSDVETRNGLQVTAINGPDTGVSDLYWNDGDLRVLDRLPACLTPQVDGRAGIPSSSGVHGWPCGTQGNYNDGIHGSWGDVRDIDDWTYHTIDEFDEIDIPAGALPAPLPECTPTAFAGLGDLGTASDWYSFDLVSGDLSQIEDNIGASNDISVNAIGYNVLDDRVYGLEISKSGTPWPTTGYVVAIGANGEATRIGPVPGLAGKGLLNVGDVGPDGVLYASSSGPASPTMVRIDLNPASPGYLTMSQTTLVDANGDAGGARIGSDWAFASSGVLYSMRDSANSGQLVAVNTTTGEVRLAATVPGLPQVGLGAQFFDADGFMYVYSSAAPAAVYRVDLGARTATHFADAEVGNNLDGARCPNAPVPVDFGDAPAGYDTLLVDDGARHGVAGYNPTTHTAPLMLGARVDIETDGVPTADADGDDADDTADEDGVVNPFVIAGHPSTITVSATNNTNESATLAGWIDLNGNGTFEAGERQTITVPANSGKADYPLTFPAGTTMATTYGRFRLFPAGSAPADILPTGPAAAGEVEDYSVVVAALDAGDAPQSYGTLLVDIGPSHAIVDGVHLGTSIDSDLDGQPGPAADGDGADEDGVVFNPGLNYPNPTIRTGVDPDSQQPISNTLDVEASADGFVSVWIDLNLDGDFTDADERVVHATPVTPGNNPVSFVYSDNPPGIETYVRVRYSTDAVWVEDPTGAALDGEVEDYRVLVERLVQPDTCTPTDTEYYAFTFGVPVDPTGNGTPGSTATYENVTVIKGIPVDMFVRVVAGGMQVSGGGSAPPNGFRQVAPDDAAWQIASDATIQYSFYEAGTTAPVAVSAVFTIDDMDYSTVNGIHEIATFSAVDLSGYGVSQGSTVQISTGGGSVRFTAGSGGASLPEQRFQFSVDGIESFQTRWQGGAGSGFGFDGDGDLRIQPPACDDFGDAPSSFGTDLASNGPHHTLTPGLTIGSEIDFDPNGQPGPTADGDDSDRIADEDAFPGGLVLNPGVTNPTLTVPVTNSLGGPATLSGWIDSNGNGRFEASEYASVAVPAGATSVALAFSGLPALQDGTSPMVRLRLTTGTLTDNAGTPNVDERALGAAPDGEVEDHLAQVATLVPISCAEPFVETFGTGAGYGPALPTGQTTYTYVGAPEPDNMIDDGDYAIVTSPRAAHTGWVIGADHTAGDTDGRMMLVNASFDEGTFFQRTFTGLAVGVEYDFSAYLTSVLSGSGISPNVTFQIVDPTTGTVLSTLDSNAIPNTGAVQWDRYNMEFTAPQSTVRLELLNNAPGGGGNDLAIDDISFSPVCEFGDAPQSYGTLIDDDGPGHIATGPTLGTKRDTESDGQPSPGADGDDTTGTPDDEDGVANPIEMSVGAEARVTVSATNNSGKDVTLAGWIDLDGNGTFQDSERVLVTVPANTGTAAYQLDFPAGTTTTGTYARFRIYGVLMTDPQSTGTVAAGEVEDYPVTVLQPQLEIDKSSNATADARPGDPITYTVTAENTGLGDYTAANPARVWDDLSGVLDDATLDTASVVSDRTPPDPAYANPIISWTGELPAGERVTITYTVTLKGGGDGTVRNVAFEQCDPADPDCDPVTPVCDPPVGGTDPETGKVCDEEVFELPKLTIAKASSRTDLPAEGERVIYTVTVTNEGPGDYTTAAPGTISDDLTAVLDDASIDTGTITASVGTATFNHPNLEWTGVLADGDSATITYEVVYNGLGNHILVNNACVPVTEAQDPQDACATVTVPGSGLDQDKVADPASGSAVEVGEEITYTLRFANTGQTAATVDTFDDLVAVLDDAAFVAGSINAETGLTATYDAAGERIDIVGTVPVGDTLEVTYRMRVRPWAAQGDHILENALQCQAGDAPACEPDVTEHRVRALDIEKTSDRTVDTEIGDTVTYTVTARNIGEADYTTADPARVWDDLTGVLDDATYNGDAATVPARVGTITYGQPIISWVGELAKGDTVTLTYTVTLKAGGDLNVRNVAFGACDPADPDCENTTPVCDPPTAAGVDPVTGRPCGEEEFGLPDITDTKSVDPADGSVVAAGDELTYELTFTNEGTAAGAVFKDDALGMLLDDAELMTPPGITVAGPGAAGVTATRNGQRIEIRGTLGASETVTVTYTVRVKPDAQRVTDGGDDMLGNFLIDPNGPPPPTACLQEADEDSTCNPVSRIVDSKSVSPADRTAVKAGEELTYTLRFENLGQGAGAVLKDDYLAMLLDDAELMTPPGITTSDPVLTASRNGQRIEIRGTLQPSQVVTVTYTVKVKPDAQRTADGGDDMLGNFLIDPTDPPPTACLQEAEEDSTCNPVSRIVDSKSVTPADRTAVKAGDELTYTLTFENLGQGAGAVTRDDYVGMWQDDATLVTPSGIQVTGAPGVTATLNGQRIEIRGTLQPSQVVTVTYTVKVKPDAQRTADGGDDMLGNFLIDPTDPPPTACELEAEEDSTCNPVSRIVDSKSVTPVDRTAVAAGDELTYTLRFENVGQGAGPVSKDDSLRMLVDDAELLTPPGITVAGSGAAGVAATRNGQRIEVRGTLGAGEVVTVTYTVRVKPDAQRVTDGGDDMLGNFLIDPNGPPPPTACLQEADEDSTCNPVSRIVDSKSVTPADRTAVEAGEELTYTLRFENLGQGAGQVFKDDALGMLLDDAELMTPPGITVAGPGAAGVTATLNGQRIEVRGTLGAGEVVTVTYTVLVKSDAAREAAGGDDMLGNFLIDPNGPPPPTACEPEADEDSTCNPVSRVVDEKSVTPADRTAVDAGDELTYTLRFENAGRGAGQVFKDDYLGMLLDDAAIVSGPTVAGQGNLTATRNGDRFEVRGTLGAGDVATVTYTVQVKTDTDRHADGGDNMLGNFLIDPNGPPPPTACEPEADEDSTCNPVRELDIEKSSDRTAGTKIGDPVTYTVTAKNTGNGDYTVAAPALVRDDLAGVLDDATYDGNAAADKPGAVSYTSPIIEWTGALAVDETVTITYTVKLKAGGDLNVRNVAWGGGGSTPKCDPRTAQGHDPVTGKPCGVVEFGLPDIVDDKQVDPKKGSTVGSGQLLTYTLTFTNNGTEAGKVSKVDNLSQVLDDATVVTAPVSSDPALTVSAITGGAFTITGTLAAKQTVTVTYGVQVKNPADMGDKLLGNYLLKSGEVPPTPEECLAQMGEDSTCNPVSDIVAEKTVDPKDGGKVEGGDVLTYTLSFTNTGKGAGQVDYVDKLAGILDDTTLVKGPKSSDDAITASLKDGKVRILGSLAGGQSATVVYTVRVKEYADQGDHVLANFLAAPGTSPTKCVTGDPMCTQNASAGGGGGGNDDGDDGGLPDTGGPALTALLAGLVLLLGGGLFLAVARRRREESGS